MQLYYVTLAVVMVLGDGGVGWCMLCWSWNGSTAFFFFFTGRGCLSSSPTFPLRSTALSLVAWQQTLLEITGYPNRRSAEVLTM